MKVVGLIIGMLMLIVAASGGYAYYKSAEAYREGRHDERERWKNHQQDFLDSLIAIETEGTRAREAILQEMVDASCRIRGRRRPVYRYEEK